MTKNIAIKVYDIDDGNERPPYNLIEHIAWLTAKLEEVPEQFRSTARVDILADSSYDSGVLRYRIEYIRPETEKEVLAREKKEQEIAFWQRRRDLETLAMLQAKYGINARQ